MQWVGSPIPPWGCAGPGCRCFRGTHWLASSQAKGWGLRVLPHRALPWHRGWFVVLRLISSVEHINRWSAISHWGDSSYLTFRQSRLLDGASHKRFLDEAAMGRLTPHPWWPPFPLPFFAPPFPSLALRLWPSFPPSFHPIPFLPHTSRFLKRQTSQAETLAWTGSVRPFLVTALSTLPVWKEGFLTLFPPCLLKKKNYLPPILN